jgi:head-tail adaptor
MEKTPYIGQLDRRIQIVQLTVVRNSVGEQITTEVEVCMAQSMMKDVSGSEDVEGKVKHLVNRTYMIRHNDQVATNGLNYVLVDGSQKFEITNIKTIGRRQYLELICRNYV